MDTVVPFGYVVLSCETVGINQFPLYYCQSSSCIKYYIFAWLSSNWSTYSGSFVNIRFHQLQFMMLHQHSYPVHLYLCLWNCCFSVAFSSKMPMSITLKAVWFTLSIKLWLLIPATVSLVTLWASMIKIFILTVASRLITVKISTVSILSIGSGTSRFVFASLSRGMQLFLLPMWLHSCLIQFMDNIITPSSHIHEIICHWNWCLHCVGLSIMDTHEELSGHTFHIGIFCYEVSSFLHHLTLGQPPSCQTLASFSCCGPGLSRLLSKLIQPSAVSCLNHPEMTVESFFYHIIILLEVSVQVNVDSIWFSSSNGPRYFVQFSLFALYVFMYNSNKEK